MEWWLYVDTDGRVLQAVQTPGIPELDEVMSAGGVTLVRHDAFAGSTADIYVKGGEVHDVPPAPAEGMDWDVPSEQWVDRRSDAVLWASIRAERDRLVAACNWVVLAAFEGGTQVPAEWAAYRRALLDLPQTYSDPRAVVWPVAPQ